MVVNLFACSFAQFDLFTVTYALFQRQEIRA
jgi:hypothetical protein